MRCIAILYREQSERTRLAESHCLRASRPSSKIRQYSAMSMTPQRKRTPWRETVRVVAVIFLLLTCADLAFPQYCSEDNESVFRAQAASALSIHAQESADGPLHNQSTQDCFCCCSHVVSSPFVSFAHVSVISVATEPVAKDVPVTSVTDPYPPPRVA